MEHAERESRPRNVRLWAAVGLLALGTLGSAVVTRTQPLTPSLISAATFLTALSTLALAAVMAPITPYPRWAHWASAGILAAWVLASPSLSLDSSSWRSDVRPQMWLMPWFVLTMASMGRRTQGVCATVGQRAGWGIVGASVVLGGISMLAERIGRLL